jgi:hypothetical protein
MIDTPPHPSTTRLDHLLDHSFDIQTPIRRPMQPLDRLRLATALGHAVPGAQLTLHTDRGEQIVVASHPAADVDPCALRRVVIAFGHERCLDHSGKVDQVTIGGALDDLGGGVYRVLRHGIEQRWIATLLEPDVVAELLVGLDDAAAEAMHGCLKPDCELGVTMLVVTSDDPRAGEVLDEIAQQAAALIFAEELLRAAVGLSEPGARSADAERVRNERGAA